MAKADVKSAFSLRPEGRSYNLNKTSDVRL